MDPWTPVAPTAAAAKAGIRFGTVGAHTSRTMMLAELRDLLAAVPARSRGGAVAEQAALFPTATEPQVPFAAALPTRDDYLRAIVADNVLGKDTASSRRTSLQRLTELYGLDPQLAVFRVLRSLWEIDVAGRPLLALLCALARDPLLRASAKAVLPLPPGTELPRATLLAALESSGADPATGAATADEPAPRFNAAILDKIARNTASSWAQSGHLEGRMRKLRRRVQPTPAAAAFALWLGAQQDLAGEFLLRTLWAAALDTTPDELFDLALAAKQRGLLRAVAGGGVRAIDVCGLDPAESR